MLINLPIADLIRCYAKVDKLLDSLALDKAAYSNLSLLQLLHMQAELPPDFLTQVERAIGDSILAKYRGAEVAELIPYIIKNFHLVHRAQAESLINDTRKLEKDYVFHSECPQGLSRLLLKLFDDLASHMDQEEAYLFPSLIQMGSVNLFPQLALAHHSHDRHLNMMLELKVLTNNFTAPAHTPCEWQQVYDRLVEFCIQLGIHIVIENQLMLSDS